LAHLAPFPRQTEISVENRQFFPPSCIFAPPLKGFPLELCIGAWVQKTRVMGLPGLTRSMTISSAVWMQCTNVTDARTDSRTDRRTDTGRQQRPILRIASRGSKTQKQ